jgi:hypothetical protein
MVLVGGQFAGGLEAGTGFDVAPDVVELGGGVESVPVEPEALVVGSEAAAAEVEDVEPADVEAELLQLGEITAFL